MDDVRDSLFSYASLVLVAIVFSFIFKESFKKMAKFENKDIASMIGIGFGVLMLIPFISLILLMTGIGISLALITFVLYIIALYIARIPVGYYIGKLIGKSWENNKYNVIINMVVGLLIIYILNLIPIVGGIVSFISILLGLGMIYKVVRSK
ncbi:MAG: hypothetical protein IJ574_03160 [Bacilli bacterium]|nr:hypothetical protein [Bacilli bacterium]